MDKRMELMRLAMLLPEGRWLFHRKQMDILRARMMGLGQGVFSGECLAGAWSVSEEDADGLIRMAKREIEEAMAEEMKRGTAWVKVLKVEGE